MMCTSEARCASPVAACAAALNGTVRGVEAVVAEAPALVGGYVLGMTGVAAVGVVGWVAANLAGIMIGVGAALAVAAVALGFYVRHLRRTHPSQRQLRERLQWAIGHAQAGTLPREIEAQRRRQLGWRPAPILIPAEVTVIRSGADEMMAAARAIESAKMPG